MCQLIIWATSSNAATTSSTSSTSLALAPAMMGAQQQPQLPCSVHETQQSWAANDGIEVSPLAKGREALQLGLGRGVPPPPMPFSSSMSPRGGAIHVDGGRSSDICGNPQRNYTNVTPPHQQQQPATNYLSNHSIHGVVVVVAAVGHNILVAAAGVAALIQSMLRVPNMQ
mmetsp:Transcript_2936/g.5415  ORF Transcript_2936/g.5415 Transcript_2936/m.5415 type:complete len:170 (-) Transcript_2936:1718-2227(-)